MRYLQAFWTDAVRGARSLGKSPGFAVAAVLTLGLGIGANSATFSVVNAVLLRPLPYCRPESRVTLWSRWKDFDKTWLSEAEILDYRRLIPGLKQVAAWSTGQANITGGDEEPVRVGIAQVHANVFSTLGAEPLLGRAFDAQEERPGAGNVAILSHRLWQSRFGGQPQAVGKTLLVDGVPRQIVGVMPYEFQLPTDFGEEAAEPTELWIPLTLNTESPSRGNHGFYAAAELQPGSSAARVTAELDTLLKNQTREGLYPEAMRMTAFAVPVADEILGGVRPALLLVFGAVSLLLLIACANVANLLLARAEVRQREIALRAALGAGQGQILRQLAAESLVLAVPAGILGVGLAWASLRAIVASGVAGVPRADAATIDARVLVFTGLVSLFTVFLFGLAPALRALRLNLTETLRESGATSVGAARQRMRGLLVVGELALSVVLLTGAGLLLKSLWALQRVDLGFEPAGVLTARVALPQNGYRQPEEVVALYRQLVEKVRALPGVQTAGLIRSLPIGSQIGDWGLTIEGRVNTPGNNAKGDWQVASDGAIEALGERVVRGRSFDATDTTGSQIVGLVNETMARTYWPGVDPIGRRFRQGGDQRPWITVVGIVKDVRHNGIRAKVKEKFYRPHAQFHLSSGSAPRNMTLVVKTAGPPMALAGALRAAVRELDPALPVAAIRPMADVVSAALATPRLTGGLVGVFAILALALSAVGIYGVLSYLVSQRSQEIGIRMAIGADRSEVLRLVLAGGLKLSVLGIVLGSLAALALGRLATGLLHEVQPHDPATFAAVPVVLLAVALVASYLPARRATRVDPLSALRAE